MGRAPYPPDNSGRLGPLDESILFGVELEYGGEGSTRSVLQQLLKHAERPSYYTRGQVFMSNHVNFEVISHPRVLSPNAKSNLTRVRRLNRDLRNKIHELKDISVSAWRALDPTDSITLRAQLLLVSQAIEPVSTNTHHVRVQGHDHMLPNIPRERADNLFDLYNVGGNESESVHQWMRGIVQIVNSSYRDRQLKAIIHGSARVLLASMDSDESMVDDVLVVFVKTDPTCGIELNLGPASYTLLRDRLQHLTNVIDEHTNCYPHRSAGTHIHVNCKDLNAAETAAFCANSILLHQALYATVDPSRYDADAYNTVPRNSWMNVDSLIKANGGLRNAPTPWRTMSRTWTPTSGMLNSNETLSENVQDKLRVLLSKVHSLQETPQRTRFEERFRNKDFGASLTSRRTGVNTAALDEHGTVEFRLFNSTVDHLELLHWLGLLARLRQASVACLGTKILMSSNLIRTMGNFFDIRSQEHKNAFWNFMDHTEVPDMKREWDRIVRSYLTSGTWTRAFGDMRDGRAVEAETLEDGEQMEPSSLWHPGLRNTPQMQLSLPEPRTFFTSLLNQAEKNPSLLDFMSRRSSAGHGRTFLAHPDFKMFLDFAKQLKPDVSLPAVLVFCNFMVHMTQTNPISTSSTQVELQQILEGRNNASCRMLMTKIIFQAMACINSWLHRDNTLVKHEDYKATLAAVSSIVLCTTNEEIGILSQEALDEISASFNYPDDLEGANTACVVF